MRSVYGGCTGLPGTAHLPGRAGVALRGSSVGGKHLWRREVLATHMQLEEVGKGMACVGQGNRGRSLGPGPTADTAGAPSYNNGVLRAYRPYSIAEVGQLLRRVSGPERHFE